VIQTKLCLIRRVEPVYLVLCKYINKDIRKFYLDRYVL
jgi:hypothetical protein